MSKLILLFSLIYAFPICAQNREWYYVLEMTLNVHDMVQGELFITESRAKCIVREEDIKYWTPDSSSVLSFFDGILDNNYFYNIPCTYFWIDSYTRACCLFGNFDSFDQLGETHDCKDTLFLPDLFRMNLSFSDKSGSNLDINIIKIQAEVCNCPGNNLICVSDAFKSVLVFKDIHEIYPPNLLKTEFKNTDVFDIIHSNFINVNISD